MTLNELIQMLESKAAGGLGERRVVFQAEDTTAVLCLRLLALEESTRSAISNKSEKDSIKAVVDDSHVKLLFTVSQQRHAG